MLGVNVLKYQSVNGAVIAEKYKNRQAAIKWYKKALKEDPEFQKARMAIIAR